MKANPDNDWHVIKEMVDRNKGVRANMNLQKVNKKIRGQFGTVQFGLENTICEELMRTSILGKGNIKAMLVIIDFDEFDRVKKSMKK